MPAWLFYRVMGLVLCLALFFTAAAASADTMSAKEYLALKKSLKGASPKISVLKANPAGYVGQTIELTGVVSGIAKCGDSASIILKCEGESFLVRAAADLPDCIANGNKIRVLVKLGPGCIASLSDLALQGTAYDYDVSIREKQLAPKPKAQKPPPKPQEPVTTHTTSLSSRGGDINPSSRIREIYGPYRAAIAKFNPKLSNEQLDTITKSVLGFSWRYQVDPRLVVAIFLVESGFKPQAKSPKGAMGLGQLMPGTARGLGVGNAYDPVQNIEGSIRLIRGHLEKYGDLYLALSAYNAGPGAVRKYGGVPPYRETQNYVRKVSQLYRMFCGK